MELCENYTLKNLLIHRKRLNETETKFYMYQLIDAVDYLHSQHIIHRDLKLENLFLDRNMNIKIGDFGFAYQITQENQSKPKALCGTPNYIAPELLNKCDYGFQIDIWSCGIIMYTMLVGQPPFHSNTVSKTFENILNNEYHFPHDINISSYAKDFIRSMLCKDPLKRPSINQLKNDIFFTYTTFPKQLTTAILNDPYQD